MGIYPTLVDNKGQHNENLSKTLRLHRIVNDCNCIYLFSNTHNKCLKNWINHEERVVAQGCAGHEPKDGIIMQAPKGWVSRMRRIMNYEHSLDGERKKWLGDKV